MFIDNKFTPVYCSNLFLRELNLDAGLNESLKRKYKKDKALYAPKNYDVFLGIEEFTSIKKVRATNDFSKGDCIYKIDMIFTLDTGNYGVQLKSSIYGVEMYHQKNNNGIHNSFSINCPAAIIPERSLQFYNQFLSFIGADWKPSSLKLLFTLEHLLRSHLNTIPIQVFTSYEKRLLKFLGYKVDNTNVYLN